ncbi:MAG: hypothetical protein FWG29_00765 [Treponema sp.]|nr:hypothetical protein [Treponema sp.]
MSGNNKRYGGFTLYILTLIPVFLVSCIGASSQIKINGDGSGTISQEYRISLELYNMGKTEGNEGMLPLPAGKEDLERTVARIPGLRMVSFSSRQDEKDLIVNADFAFDSPEALAALMENGDQQFQVDLKGKKITLRFPAGENSEPAFKEMIESAFLGYNFSFSLSVPGPAKTAWFDGNGKSVQRYPGTCSVRNNTVDYTVSMGDLVYLDAPLDLEIGW